MFGVQFFLPLIKLKLIRHNTPHVLNVGVCLLQHLNLNLFLLVNKLQLINRLQLLNFYCVTYFGRTYLSFNFNFLFFNSFYSLSLIFWNYVFLKQYIKFLFHIIKASFSHGSERIGIVFYCYEFLNGPAVSLAVFFVFVLSSRFLNFVIVFICHYSVIFILPLYIVFLHSI